MSSFNLLLIKINKITVCFHKYDMFRTMNDIQYVDSRIVLQFLVGNLKFLKDFSSSA